MYGIVITISFLIFNSVASKSFAMKNFDLSKEVENLKDAASKYSLTRPSKFHNLFKRMTSGTKSSSETGFAAIISSPQEESRKKTKICLNWEKQPITGQWKCLKVVFAPRMMKSSFRK